MNMKFIKKHASLVVAVLVFVLVVAGLLILKEFFSPSENKAIYGNRLEARKNVIISDETKTNVEKSLKEQATDANVRIAGRIIEVNIKVADDTSLEAAKTLGDKSLEGFSDKEKEYYDVQIFVSKANDSNQFPIVGYKHHTKNAISWTKDRAES